MINSSSSNISVSQAREIATQLASYHLAELLSDGSVKLLRDKYLEAENCWMFFINEEIVIPPKYTLSHFSYCVSKKGNSRSVPDFSDDPIQLQKYLKDMSDYFAQDDL